MAGSVIRSCRNNARCHLAPLSGPAPARSSPRSGLLAVDLELGEAVDAPRVGHEAGVAADVAQYPVGVCVVGALVLDADAVLGVGQVVPVQTVAVHEQS